MPEISQTFSGDKLAQDVDSALHRLWTKSVGTDDYVKAEWMQLEQLIHQLIRRSRQRGGNDEQRTTQR